MKIIFMGTPDFAVPVLKSLIENFEVVLVVSQPDKPVGRKQVLTPSPVKEVAIANNIQVLTPDKVSTITDEILELAPDFIVSCAYGQIIPQAILDIAKYYPLNVHASLLPKYRGAAPIQRAIMAGESETGISIMEMEAGLDTGGVFISDKVYIHDTDNYETIHDQLSSLGAKLIIEAINMIEGNDLKPTPQDDTLATYASKIVKADEYIDFNQDVKKVFNHIRSLNPVPGARCILFGKEMKIFDIEYQNSELNDEPGSVVNLNKNDFSITCLNGFITVKTIQVIGKNKITSKDFVNSLPK